MAAVRGKLCELVLVDLASRAAEIMFCQVVALAYLELLSIDKLPDGKPLVKSKHNIAEMRKIVNKWIGTSTSSLLGDSSRDFYKEGLDMMEVEHNIFHESGLDSDNEDDFDCQSNTDIDKSAKDIDLMIDALRRDCAMMRQTGGIVSPQRVLDECLDHYKSATGYEGNKVMIAELRTRGASGRIKLKQREMIIYALAASNNYMASILLAENFKSLIRAVVHKVQELEAAEDEVKARGAARASRRSKALYNVAEKIVTDGAENLIGQLFNAAIN